MVMYNHNQNTEHIYQNFLLMIVIYITFSIFVLYLSYKNNTKIQI